MRHTSIQSNSQISGGVFSIDVSTGSGALKAAAMGFNFFVCSEYDVGADGKVLVMATNFAYKSREFAQVAASHHPGNKRLNLRVVRGIQYNKSTVVSTPE